ncbi:MAG: hypothetical protein KAI70_05530 [Candidatus Omnitrophica bacterium]|nr:hypothetical protein [Candidatus Omnitrophota bacterium]
MIDSRLKICFMGANQAGLIGALTILADGNEIVAAVSYSKELEEILKFSKIPVFDSINNDNFLNVLKICDLLVCVHGREIVKDELLKLPRLGAINVHPYLYKYKGKDPVGRALKDKNFKASVGIHSMGNKVDEGKVITELFTDISGSENVDEAYNKLYPYYCKSILEALNEGYKGAG